MSEEFSVEMGLIRQGDALFPPFLTLPKGQESVVREVQTEAN